MFQGKRRKMLGTARHRAHFFWGWLKSTSPMFQTKVKAESLRKCPKHLTERNHVFWVLCSNLTKFFWTRKYNRAREPLREQTGKIPSKTENPLGSVLKMILFQKRSSSGQQKIWLGPSGGLPHSARSSRRDSLLLPWDFFRKTEEGAFQKSTLT